MSALDLARSDWSPDEFVAVDLVKLAYGLSNLDRRAFEQVEDDLGAAIVADDKVSALRVLGFGPAVAA